MPDTGPLDVQVWARGALADLLALDELPAAPGADYRKALSLCSDIAQRHPWVGRKWAADELEDVYDLLTDWAPQSERVIWFRGVLHREAAKARSKHH